MACSRAQTVFNWGKRVEGIWGDAEEFLEFTDRAEADHSAAVTLIRLAGTAKPLTQDGTAEPVVAPAAGRGANEIRDDALRAVAAECSWFATSSKSNTERWQPYRAWTKSLTPGQDTIVTFNHDPVVELASEPSTIHTIMPQAPAPQGATAVRLIKMHGSVTWRRSANGCEASDADTLLKSPSGFMVLGTPGRSKRELQTELLEPLWRVAEEAIRSAELVVFVGYRFPESDGDSRRRLLGAISSNRSRHLRTRVILGPDLSHGSVVRLKRMLEVSGRRARELYLDRVIPSEIPSTQDAFELIVEPLFAEDFLSLVSEDGPLASVL